MYDHGSGNYDGSTQSKSKSSATQEADRRGTDRHMVIAPAEIVELSSGARFSTRTTDLGPGGCFVDTLTPFPVGSQVRVTVFRDKTNFETRGTVVYSQSGLGMGIAFGELEPRQRAALDAWLAELTGGRIPAPAPAVQPQAQKQKAGNSDRAVLIRLVQLMISKGMLTESEAKSIFYDPLI